MAAQDEVQSISNKLDALMKESISGSSQVTDYLRALEKQPIDLSILQSTNIGRTVNSLRKETKDEEVASLCKSLVKSWKSLLTPSPANGSGDATRTEPERKKIKKEDGADGAVASKEKLIGSLSRSSSSSSFSSPPTPATTPTATKPAPGKPPPPISVKSTAAATPNVQTNGGGAGGTDTRDEVRIRSRELLEKALRKEAPPDGSGDAGMIATDIETAIFREFKGTDMKYKNRIRNRIMCIQDAKNPRLRENILLGHISAERVAVMTSEEMASKEMKELRDRLTKETIEARSMSVTGGTETDLFQCGKCKQKKCTYNQVQTRSADEPMTTFVYCTNCGNRWKFC